MKTRNVRRKQWEKYVRKVRYMPIDPMYTTMGSGYLRQWIRDFDRRRAYHRNLMQRQQLKNAQEVWREGVLDRETIARIFDVPVDILK